MGQRVLIWDVPSFPSVRRRRKFRSVQILDDLFDIVEEEETCHWFALSYHTWFEKSRMRSFFQAHSKSGALIGSM